MLIVGDGQIMPGQFEEVMGYLRESPSSGDEDLRRQRALFDLIRIEAVAAAFIENEGQIKLGEVLGELNAGKDIAELAKTHGTVQTGKEDGSVEVTRNSIHGPRFEQIAFSTEPGTMARPFQNAFGYVVMRVDSIEKGATPQQDKVHCHVVQIPYTDDTGALQQAQFAINSGQVQVLARDKETLDMLPALFKPPMATPRPGFDRQQLEAQIAAVQAQIQKAEQSGDEAAAERVKMLAQQLEAMQKQLEELGKTDADVTSDAAADPVPGLKPTQEEKPGKAKGSDEKKKEGNG
jgi:hypothetical protein